MKINIKMKATTIALFAAMNFALVDLSESTFVYAPQNIKVVEKHPVEVIAMDVESNTAAGTIVVIINDGGQLPKQVVVNFNAQVDMQYIPTNGDESFELRGFDEVSLSCEDKVLLINGSKTQVINYRLSEYQCSRIKDIVCDTIASLSSLDGVILDDARAWYCEA